MLLSQTDIFIEVVCDRFGEVENSFSVEADEFLIGGNGGGTGCQSEYTVGFPDDLRRNHGGCSLAGLLGSVKHTDTHMNLFFHAWSIQVVSNLYHLKIWKIVEIIGKRNDMYYYTAFLCHVNLIVRESGPGRLAFHSRHVYDLGQSTKRTEKRTEHGNV